MKKKISITEKILIYLVKKLLTGKSIYRTKRRKERYGEWTSDEGLIPKRQSKHCEDIPTGSSYDKGLCDDIKVSEKPK